MNVDAKGPRQACEPLDPGAGRSGSPVTPERRRWRDGQGEHIDVRGLAPPQPLVEILRLVHEQGPAGAAVIVHHDRDPLLLYPELAEIGWVAQPLAGDPGELVLRLSPAP